MSKALQGKVCVVAGATRGAGRGIAVMLGAAGATVYCTGRSVRGDPSDLNRLETIEETAEMVTAAGSVGIPVQVDHCDEGQEEMLDYFGVTEANWRDAVKSGLPNAEHFMESETPFFIGKGIAALAADPDVFRKTGQALGSWDLADEYGFTDVDGRTPHWGHKGYP